MILELYSSNGSLYCHVKDTVLEHTTEGIIMMLMLHVCLFHSHYKSLMVLLCLHLPLLYFADQTLRLSMVAWQQSTFQINMRLTYLVHQGKEGKLQSISECPAA